MGFFDSVCFQRKYVSDWVLRALQGIGCLTLSSQCFLLDKLAALLLQKRAGDEKTPITTIGSQVEHAIGYYMTKSNP